MRETETETESWELTDEWRETLVVLVAVISGGSLTLVTSSSGVGASVPTVLDRG
jgi:hypothetical protein